MWEAIAANRRRSTWLILLMGAVLVTFGASLGLYYGTAYSGPQPTPERVLTAAAVSITAPRIQGRSRRPKEF